MAGKIEDYEVLEVIGTGSFGTCYKVQNKRTQRIYVWKAIDYGSMTEEKKQLLVSEVNLLSELNHPHIVRYYDRILHKETTTIYIIMEWCEGGDLASLIKRHKSQGMCVEELFVWRVLYQTGRALQACHSHLRDRTVLHRDIKPANVFLDSRGNVKLGDFGLARVLQGSQACADTVVGTPFYMSPEVIKGNKYDRKSDIWALGCLIYELCALSPPFIGSDMKQLAINIKEGRFNPIPANYSEELQKIIELLLSVEHQYRPTVEMILHHPTVVLKVSTKSSFKFANNKRDHFKTECDKATLALVSNKVKALCLAEKEPEEITEDIFHEKWMARLEALRQREASIRKKEETLLEKERFMMKKEKQLLLMERLTKEKLERAEVYLRQCKENRSSQMLVIPPKPLKYKIIEDLDTSFSADPGDTSVLPTSAKIDPAVLPPPSNFVRSASERRPKHVRFNKALTIPNNQENTSSKSKNSLSDLQEWDQSHSKIALRKVLGEIQRIDSSQVSGAVPNKLVGAIEKSATLKPSLLSNLNWHEEKRVWLENKRASYLSALRQENIENVQYELKESKKRSSKLSLFSRRQNID